MPDDELFALAAKGQLRANLDAQVTRMLKEPESRRRWWTISPASGCGCARWKTSAPTPSYIPHFDPELRDAMLTETQMFFSSIKDEDRSVLDFIDADYSFVNGRLAKFYGLDGIHGR